MSGSGALYSFDFRAMGTKCTFHGYADGEVQAAMAFAAVLSEVERIEKKYSRYDPASVVSAINRAGAAGGAIAVDDETASLLDYAYACHAKSDGRFDITAGVLRQCWDFASARLPDPEAVRALLPRIGLHKLGWQRPGLSFCEPGMEIDLGGIGKEYAVDRAAKVMAEAGIESGLIELGGDIAVLGPHPDGRPWPIGLRHPRRGDAIAAQMELHRGALATSGDYERSIEIGGRRYGHILDPRTGWPVEGMASVTVVAESCMLAGSVATIAMLRGPQAPAWLTALGLPHFWMDTDGRQGGALPAVRAASS